MKKLRYVVDASVVVKALLKESEKVTKKFEKILALAESGGVLLLSHSLLPLEVANALRFSQNPEEVIRDLYKVYLTLPIESVELTGALKEEILAESYRFKTTVYDTSYHILAKAYGAVFLTSDREYFKKAKALGDIELVA